MATSEEKQELVEDIKKPIRYYRLRLWGYGGEGAYLGLAKESWEYWSNKIEQDDNDEELVSYLTDPESYTGDLTREADFQCDAEGFRYQWYESPHEIVHHYGVDFESAHLTLEEITADDFNSDLVDTVYDGIELVKWQEENELWDNVEVGEVEEIEQPYMLQFYSAEKGTFFEAVFASQGRFDPNKLIIRTTEYFNGDNIVDEVEYDGEVLDNFGGDTTGKGYILNLWKNE